MHIQKKKKREKERTYQNPTHAYYLALLPNLSTSQNMMYLHTSRTCHKISPKINQLKTKSHEALSFIADNCFYHLIKPVQKNSVTKVQLWPISLGSHQIFDAKAQVLTITGPWQIKSSIQGYSRNYCNYFFNIFSFAPKYHQTSKT